jgi:hypothetical protein
MMSTMSPVSPKMDSAELRRLLLDAARAQPEAQAYFETRAEDAALLKTLFEIALADSSDTRRLQAAYYISRFPARLLSDYEDDLVRLQAAEWESLSEHAIVALAKLRSQKGLIFLIEKRLAPKLPWETKILRGYVQDLLKE